ncbi:MAG: enolase C-terminal domain-like protein [Chloroflexota bacterium]
MKITDVIITEVHGIWPEAANLPRHVQVKPLSLYPEFAPTQYAEQSSDRTEMRALYVDIQTDEGISGLFGPIQRQQAFVIDNDLRPFLIGRDPLATELLLDQMMRIHRHGRSGIFMTGISPIDCALWDLKGKAWDKPIYRLLGGPTRPEVPAYVSTLGYSVEPEDAAQTAQTFQSQGFAAQKWFFAYGPGQGQEGLEKNLAMAEAVRSAVGPHYMLMFDAFMGWDVPYATKMLRGLEPLNPAWMEEPIPPERVSEFRKLRQSTNIPIATGEHVFTRWQTKELLVNGAVDWLQNDPDWTGGITELTKICALASSFEVPLIAHGHSLLAALHVAGAQSPATVPMVEYLYATQPLKQYFHKPMVEPESGVVKLPELPGLGLALDESKIEAQKRIQFS